MDSFAEAMRNTFLANPHSDAANPSASSVIVADTRSKVLQFFQADQDHFDVVFTANATAAVKLVMDCFSGQPEGFDYYYHRNCHTSLVGVRELASRSHCLASNEETEAWLHGSIKPFLGSSNDQTTLFAYPAQSNMSGERLPLTWPHQLRESRITKNTYTLLDAAALVSTSPLDLSKHTTAPDFVAMSFYKIFGFPDLGALIVRKASSHVLEHRRYFGGGTTDIITCFGDKPWAARKQSALHSRLEDGTIAIRSILALRCAIGTHKKLFGGISEVSKHTSFLAKRLHEQLVSLKHANGLPVCHIYKATASRYGDSTTQGATIALNICKSDGTWVGPHAMGVMLRAEDIHVRTGSFCNPGGVACALDLSPTDLKKAHDNGYTCNKLGDIPESGMKLFGMIRVTLGAMSTLEDIDRFANFVEAHFADHQVGLAENAAPSIVEKASNKTIEAASWQGKAEASENEKPVIKSHEKKRKLWRRITSCFRP